MSGEYSYKYHCFISYCTADEGLGTDPQSQWVTSLQSTLRTKVKSQLPSMGDGNFNIHFQGLKPLVAGDLEANLRKAIEQSQVLIVVAGKNYAKSDICGLEIKHFIESNPNNTWRDRIFILCMTKSGRETLLQKYEELQGLTYLDFYTDSDTSTPIPPTTEEYGKKILWVASKLSDIFAPPNRSDNSRDTGLNGPFRPTPVRRTRWVVAPPYGDRAIEMTKWIDQLKTETLNAGIDLDELSETQALTSKRAALAEILKCDSLLIPFGTGDLIGNTLGGHVANIVDIACARESDRPSPEVRYVSFERKTGEFLNSLDKSDKEYLAKRVSAPVSPQTVLDEFVKPPPSSSLTDTAQILLDRSYIVADNLKTWVRTVATSDPVRFLSVDLRKGRGICPKNLADSNEQECIDSLKKADGVVVIYLWDQENPDTIKKVIKYVETLLQRARDETAMNEIGFAVVVLGNKSSAEDVPRSMEQWPTYLFVDNNGWAPFSDDYKNTFLRSFVAEVITLAKTRRKSH